MTPRGVIALAVAAAVSVAGATWQLQANSSGYEEAQRGDRLLPDLLAKANDVAAIVVSQADRSVRIERAGTSYVLGGSGYPVKGGKFQTAIVATASLEKFDAKTARADKYPLIEVEPPAEKSAKGRLIRFEDASGKDLGEIIVGKKARGRLGGAVGDGQYVRLPGDAQSWLARGVVDADIKLDTWVDTAITDMNVEFVVLATFQPAGGPELVVRRTGVTQGGQSKFEVNDVPEGKKPKNDLTLRYAATDLGNVNFVDVRKDQGGDVVQRVTLMMADGLTSEFRITADNWVSLHVVNEGQDKTTTKDLKARTQGWQYKLADYKLKQLQLTMSDLTE
ncbi:DUF4340 domain-containing protein [Anderseniella sp. Alg231-50]|uniref:DUF4340 domain-containing protein n=1 Tax=Anderseniella sp. Alg231-50 TaxID=1922226 RepID=UPI000D5572E9